MSFLLLKHPNCSRDFLTWHVRPRKIWGFFSARVDDRGGCHSLRNGTLNQRSVDRGRGCDMLHSVVLAQGAEERQLRWKDLM